MCIYFRGTLLLSLIHFLTFVVPPAGAAHAATDADSRVAASRWYLRTLLDSGGKFSKDDDKTFLRDVKQATEHLSGYRRYMSLAYQRAWTVLDGAAPPAFRHPLLLSAVFHGSGNEIILHLCWLSSANDKNRTRAIYVQDSHRAVLARAQVTSTEPDEHDGLLQNGYARMSPNGDEDIPQLTLDPKSLSGELLIGFVENDGARAEPVKAFIEPNLEATLRALLVLPVESVDVRRMNRTREAIEELLAFVRDFSTGDTKSDRYQSRGFQRGLDALKAGGATTFKNPMALMAIFHKGRADKGLSTTAGVYWLSSKDNVAKIYVQDAKGNVIAETPVSSEFRSRDFLQFQSATVSSAAGGGKAAHIGLSREDLANRLWVGLVLRDGSRAKAVEAYVETEQ